MKAHIVLGLSYGDEGKGAAVDYLAASLLKPLVVRFGGGAQCAHNVVTPGGLEHTFHLFGSATYQGVPTYLGSDVLIDPFVINGESHDLGEPQSLFADPNCLITTPLHRRMSEAWANENPGRSTGMGVWETRMMEKEHPDLSIHLRDLNRVGKVMELLTDQMKHYGLNVTEEELAFWTAKFAEASNRIWTIGFKSLASQYENLIFEGHQGLLLNGGGFGTSSDTTPKNAYRMCQGVTSDIKLIGAMRIYATRHGKGTLDEFWPQADKLPERHNDDHGYPGRFRVGWHNLRQIQADLQDFKVDEIYLSHVDRWDTLPWWMLDGKVQPTLKGYCEHLKKRLAPVTLLAFGPTRRDRREAKFV